MSRDRFTRDPRQWLRKDAFDVWDSASFAAPPRGGTGTGSGSGGKTIPGGLIGSETIASGATFSAPTGAATETAAGSGTAGIGTGPEVL